MTPLRLIMGSRWLRRLTGWSTAEASPNALLSQLTAAVRVEHGPQRYYLGYQPLLPLLTGLATDLASLDGAPAAPPQARLRVEPDLQGVSLVLGAALVAHGLPAKALADAVASAGDRLVAALAALPPLPPLDQARQPLERALISLKSASLLNFKLVPVPLELCLSDTLSVAWPGHQVTISGDAPTLHELLNQLHLLATGPDPGRRPHSFVLNDQGLKLSRRADHWRLWALPSPEGPGAPVELSTLEESLRQLQHPHAPLTPEQTPTPKLPPLPVPLLHRVAYRRAWRREIPDFTHIYPTESAILVSSPDGIRAIGRQDGRDRFFQPELSPLSPEQPELVYAESGELWRISLHDGQPRWRVPIESRPAQVLSLGNTVAVWTMDGRLFGLDSRTGTARFRIELNLSAMAGRPGELYTVDDTGWLACRKETGALRFQLRLPTPPSEVLTATDHGLLTELGPCADEATRLVLLHRLPEPRWLLGLPGQVIAPPLIQGDHAHLLFSRGHRLTVAHLSLTLGELRWARTRGVATDDPPKLVQGGDWLALKWRDGRVDALGATTGKLLWRLPPDDREDELASNASLVIARGLLLVPGAVVRVVDPACGRVVQAVDGRELVPGWLHAWTDGDWAIAEDGALAYYRLAGHIARVD